MKCNMLDRSYAYNSKKSLFVIVNSYFSFIRVLFACNTEEVELWIQD